MTNAPVVGLVVTGFDKGGLEQVVYNLYTGYRTHGIVAYILCEKPDSVGYFATRLYDIRDIHIFDGDTDRFLSFCYRKRITHLHYHYNTFFIEQAKQYGIRTIYTIHNTYIWFDDYTMLSRGYQLKAADVIVAVSSSVRDYFCARAQVDSRLVKIIPNGIDFDDLDGEELPCELTRESMGLSKDDIVIGFIASFFPSKAQIGIIHVMERIAARNSRIHMLLIGNVGDQSYYDEFLRRYNVSSVKKNLHIIPFFPHEYMGAFLRKTIDIFTLPTLYEGCSNAVLEAIYCGKPAVITNVGNAMDIEGASVKVVSPAYRNLQSLNMEDLLRISKTRIMRNASELVDAYIDVADHLEAYTSQAALYAQNTEHLSREQMVDQYVHLLRSNASFCKAE